MVVYGARKHVRTGISSETRTELNTVELEAMSVAPHNTPSSRITKHFV